ncbi:MAG TPA: M56 family metallopeptidase, partial [Acidobacteriota bacterium]|nr:M56 family metallopeptidase [Acidobacteriota bacterium]
MPGAGLPGLMAGYLLKTTAVLIVALLAAAASKRRPAALRHFILSSALAGLLLLPLLSLAPVGWRSPLLPAWMAASSPHPADAPKIQAPARASKARHAVRLNAGTREDGARSGVGLGGEWVSLSPASTAGERPALKESSPLLQKPSAIKAPGRPALPGLLLAILWSAGLAVLLLRLAFGLAGAARLTAEGTPLDTPDWRVLLERFVAFVALRREVRLKSHPEVVMPLTWGFRRPIVLFPDGTDGWSDDERSSALYHELSHVKRADFVAMLLVRTSLALFWWNPLCWIVYREILKAQEIACDELVLRAGIKPSAYAASLLAFRRSAGFRWSPSAALLGLIGRPSFEGRLAAILKQKLTFMEVKMKTKIMLTLALVLAVALIGTAGPAAGREPSVATALAVSTLPAPAGFEITAPAAEAQEVAAEKAVTAEQAKEKEKAAKEKALAEKTAIGKRIVITGKEGVKAPVEIVITEGDTVKTLTLDTPVTISKGKDGGTLVLSRDGKEIQVLKGEPLRLEIKGGDLRILREGKDLRLARNLGESGDLQLIKEDDKDGVSVVVVTEPKIAVGRMLKKIEAEEAEPEVLAAKIKEVKPDVWVSVAPGKEARKVRIATEVEPEIAWTVKEDGRAVSVVRPDGNREMLEKVRALQEQVQAIKAKKMDLAALEESLKKLEAELKANEEKLRTFSYKFDRGPGEVAVTKKFRAAEDHP